MGKTKTTFTTEEIKASKMLQELRIKAGLTLRELAKVLGVQSGELCNVENLKKKPSHRIILAYHKFFKIPLNILMGVEDSTEQGEIYNFKVHYVAKLKEQIEANIVFLNKMLQELDSQ